jgi:hypothetical protein
MSFYNATCISIVSSCVSAAQSPVRNLQHRHTNQTHFLMRHRFWLFPGFDLMSLISGSAVTFGSIDDTSAPSAIAAPIVKPLEGLSPDIHRCIGLPKRSATATSTNTVASSVYAVHLQHQPHLLTTNTKKPDPRRFCHD